MYRAGYWVQGWCDFSINNSSLQNVPMYPAMPKEIYIERKRKRERYGSRVLDKARSIYISLGTVIL